MRFLLVAVFAFVFSLAAFSQSDGIRFEDGSTWKMVLAKAKREHKYIFVDCYTSWCGPCKYMAKNVFPLKETGDELNPHFLNFSIQLDTSARDSDTIKNRYADAHFINTTYNITAYPTFLFFNSDGHLVHRVTGAAEAPQFISWAMDALNPGKQYYTMISGYRHGNRDTLFLESLAKLAKTNMNVAFQDSVLQDWYDGIKDPFIKGRPELIAEVTKKSSDKGFKLFYDNAAQIDELAGPEFAELTVENIIVQENDNIQSLFKSQDQTPDWDKLQQIISQKYSSEYAHRVISWIKVPFYKNKKNWILYGPSLANFLREYGANQQVVILNNYAWDIFQYCDQKEDLATGIDCIQRALKFDPKQHAEYKDTYANLLYKSGKTEEAIAIETEAMNQVNSDQQKPYQDTIDKMKSGVKTWD